MSRKDPAGAMVAVLVGLGGLGGLGGCAGLDSGAKVREAAELARERVGELPEWQGPWDSAPAWESGSILTQDQAVGLALRNNRELRADLELIGEADADLLQAGLLQNPVIQLMLMFPDGGGRAMLRANALPMMPLQDLWLIPARRKVAKATLQEAVLRVADRAVETAAAVKRVYARLQYAQRALELLNDNLELVNQSTRIISTRQAAGRGTQVQVNLSQIRWMKLRSEYIAMQAEYASLQRELLMLMGLAAAPADWRVTPLSELKDEIPGPLDESALVASALEQRLDVLAAQWETQAAQHNITLAQREGLPDVAMGFTLERAPAPPSNNQRPAGVAGNALAQGLYDRATGMPSVAPLGTPFMPKQRDVKWTLGPMIELEVPIFDHGQGKVARAMAEYRRKYAMYEARVQDVTRTVREKWLMLKQAGDQVRFYRGEVAPAVERNLDVARRSFIAGQEDLTVYLEVQEDLLMTRLKILEFYRDCLVYRAELERAAGGRLGAAGPQTRPADLGSGVEVETRKSKSE